MSVSWSSARTHVPHAPPGPSPDWSERRADARRNHEQIIAAAIEVFSEKGLAATVPEVAARAGVGKATVYRSYPTKDALVEAVAEHQLSWVDARLMTAAEHADPVAGLHGFIRDVFALLAGNQLLLAQVLPQQDRPMVRARTLQLLAGIVDAARDQGALRPDVTAMDVRVLIGGCSRVLSELGIRDPEQWRRYADMVMAALRP
ncbi:TetR/AcrR family transcriptional regulator [Parafrankia sp. FMc2]|uniref:TetR/AcrR family transcriptional regulator n=1 Tax=Parafrankia sp. FMc2 TaxID=3233196 RepID=UPI0034D40782